MNRDDIIRMAREAGFREWLIQDSLRVELERFAALVAAAERAETERLMAGQALIREIDAQHQARIDEREACAVIVSPCCKDCAKEIRARGEK